jgi:hypothetical protein
MIIEQNTNYAYKLKYTDNPTFDKVRDLSTKFYRELPHALQDELHDALKRGIDILDSEPQMTAYMSSFGKMHQAKLEYAFGKLPEEFLEQSEINIIDYGCGQALGTMCYSDYLRDNGYAQNVRTITLVEPSKICLKRAALHASVFFPEAKIKTVNKKFDDLTQDDIVCDEETSTLHILSNVLDMLSFDIDKFANLVKGCLKGYNQFVCVGPFFGSSDKSERMEVFCSLLGGNKGFYGMFDKNELIEDKTWTAQLQCFSIGKLTCIKSSTTATVEKNENWVEDEFGVVYSKDGKKLLRCKNKYFEKYSIKNRVYVICNEAFEECSTIKQIIIPNTVSVLGESAFLRCFSLQQIKIPNSVLEIADGTFAQCRALRQIIIPNSVVRIGKCAFGGCSSLKQVLMSNSVTAIADYTFFDCSSLQQIALPDSIRSIGDSAFRGCKNLLQITLPDSITTIECKAFFECSSLRIITIPRSVISIGVSAFGGCSSLQQISISDLVKSIGDSTFWGCSSLQQISIPNSVISIADYAFSGCSALQQITLPDSIISIGRSAFSSCKSLLQITLPDSISTVAGGTFRECSSLQKITIPDSVTRIGEVAFVECSSLLDITISCSVTNIGEEAFGKCTSLQQISIKNPRIEIGSNAFGGCISLQQIFIPKGSTERFKKMLDKELWDKLVEE